MCIHFKTFLVLKSNYFNLNDVITLDDIFYDRILIHFELVSKIVHYEHSSKTAKITNRTI